MNTTVRSDVLSEGQNLTTPQEEALKELRIASAATTMQLKTNNVGPDKVIDTCMTDFTQTCASQGDAGKPVPSVSVAVTALADACIQALETSAKSAQGNYQEAIAGVKAAKEDGIWDTDIAADVQLWAKENGFV